jgi:DNA-binding IclR family transcriptional regulator
MPGFSSSTHSHASRTERRQPTTLALEIRVRAEFEEMHGLRLSPAQACRLFGLEPATCTRVLESLSSKGFLKKDARGRYCWAQLDV